MTDPLFFLDYTARATPAVLVIIGALGFYFREKLKQILSRSLLTEVEAAKASLAKELTNHSSQLQRDVEAYKVSLIAEAERVKAYQDVRKSLALKIAERKFTSIVGLLDAHMGFDIAVAAHVGLAIDPADEVRREVFLKSVDALMEHYAKYDLALNAANPFLAIEIKQVGVQFRQLAVGILGERASPESRVIPSEDPRVQAMLGLSTELERRLRDAMHRLEGIEV